MSVRWSANVFISFCFCSNVIQESTTFNHGIDRNTTVPIHHAKRWLFPISNDTNHAKSYPLVVGLCHHMTAYLETDIYSTNVIRTMWKWKDLPQNRFNYKLLHFSSYLFWVIRFWWLSFGMNWMELWHWYEVHWTTNKQQMNWFEWTFHSHSHSFRFQSVRRSSMLFLNKSRNNSTTTTKMIH